MLDWYVDVFPFVIIVSMGGGGCCGVCFGSDGIILSDGGVVISFPAIVVVSATGLSLF